MERMEELKSYMNEVVSDGVFPGATYAVIHNGMIYSDFVGLRSTFPFKIKNDIRTKYDIAAVTTVLVANTLICQLVEADKLKFEDDISVYLDGFKHKGITVYHLLTHTSGLPSDIDTTYIKDDLELLKSINELKLEKETGKAILYSEINSLLLGKIVESITGRTLDVEAEKFLFEKLRMNNTGYNPVYSNDCAPTEFDRVEGLIHARVHDSKARLLRGISGHDGIFTNIDDMINFCKMIIDDGKFMGEHLIEKKYIDMWFEPLVSVLKGYDNSVPSPSINGVSRGLGYISGKNYYSTGDYASDETISHVGFTGCSILVDRKNDISFILLSNRVHTDRNNRKLFDYRPLIIEKVYEIFIKDIGTEE